MGAAGTTVSTVHVRVAAADVFPSASLARTSKVCAPSARPEWPTGEVQTPNAAPSSRHSNVTPPSVSEKPKLALVDETAPVGPESIVGTGGATVSTDQAREADGRVPGRVLRLHLERVRALGEARAGRAGEVQAANAAASSLHSSVTPPSVSENVNVAAVEATVPLGPESIVGIGGATVSTVQVREVVPEVFADGVLGADLEGVGALAQARVVDGGDADGERIGVEAALENGAALAVGERERSQPSRTRSPRARSRSSGRAGRRCPRSTCARRWRRCFRRASLARTSKVWEPWARLV